MIVKLLNSVSKKEADSLPIKQIKIKAEFMAKVMNRPANDPIFYTNILPDDDEFIVPYQNGLMDEDNRVSPTGEKMVNNVLIETQPTQGKIMGHMGAVFSPVAFSAILCALEHKPIIVDYSRWFKP